MKNHYLDKEIAVMMGLTCSPKIEPSYRLVDLVIRFKSLACVPS